MLQKRFILSFLALLALGFREASAKQQGNGTTNGTTASTNATTSVATTLATNTSTDASTSVATTQTANTSTDASTSVATTVATTISTDTSTSAVATQTTKASTNASSSVGTSQSTNSATDASTSVGSSQTTLDSSISTSGSTGGSSSGETGPTSTPSSSSSTTTVTTTTQSVVTTSNGHPDPSINQICPQNSGVNDKIRKKALEMHNYRRSLLAAGQVTKKNNNYMPRASNMIELKYDCTLEVAARDRAQSCATNEIQGGLENKHMVAVSSVKDRIEAMEKGVKQWWKQVRKDTPLGMAVTFRDHHQYLPIRSFTRMAWANTQKIGCAVKRCGERWNVVCHYDPAGNIVDQPIYIRGKPCSQCPYGASCSNNLCVLP